MAIHPQHDLDGERLREAEAAVKGFERDVILPPPSGETSVAAAIRGILPPEPMVGPGEVRGLTLAIDRLADAVVAVALAQDRIAAVSRSTKRALDDLISTFSGPLSEIAEKAAGAHGKEGEQ